MLWSLRAPAQGGVGDPKEGAQPPSSLAGQPATSSLTLPNQKLHLSNIDSFSQDFEPREDWNPNTHEVPVVSDSSPQHQAGACLQKGCPQM